MVAAATAARSTSGGWGAVSTLLQLAGIATVCLIGAAIGGLTVGAIGTASAVPMFAALALVLIPALVAHVVSDLASRSGCAYFALAALTGTGLRLFLTLGGAVVVAITASWGGELAFWIPLAASYLATLTTELIFNIRKVGDSDTNYPRNRHHIC